MKYFICILAAILLLFTAGTVYALDFQFGTKIEMYHARDYSDWEWLYGFTKSHEEVVISLENSIEYPVYSPDEADVAFSNNIGIWLISARGGEPELLFDTVMYFEEEDIRSAQNCRTLCFTPDGSEVTFMYYTYDEDFGSYIEYPEGSTQAHVRFPCPVIASVNINTGNVRTIVKNALSGYWRDDENAFVFERTDDPYFDSSEYHTDRDLYIKNMGSGDETFVTSDEYMKLVRPGFSADNNGIFHTAEDGNSVMQVYKYSISDDSSEQLTLFEEQDVIMTGPNMNLSPDGEWLLYAGMKHFDELYNVAENVWTFYAFNTISKETTRIIQPTPHSVRDGYFLSNGTKISYILDDAVDAYKRHILLKEFDLDSVHVADESPESYSLIQSFPNPFNPSTTIEFSLPSQGFAELAIYNTTGQKIRTLVSNDLAQGAHTLVWDGKNESGVTVSSGVYITKLSAGSTSISQRMTLMK